MPSGPPSTSGQILVLALDTLGDLVLRQPLFSALLERGFAVTVVARRGYQEILPFLDPRLRSLTIDIDPHNPPDELAWQRLHRLVGELALLQPRTVVAAAFNRTYVDEWIAAQLPGCTSVGFTNPSKPTSLLDGLPGGRRQASAVIFDRLIDCPVDEHESGKQARIFTTITGEAMSERLPQIALEPRDLEQAAQVLARLGLEPGRFVFGGPAGTVTIPLKAWPPAQFAEIAAAIHSRHGLPTLLAGVRSEAAILEAVAAAGRERGIQMPIWIGEPGQLGATLGLIAHSRAYLGNDSGPMHCAGALGVPVVARFGGGHWPRFLPLAPRAFTATQQLPCFGCAWQCWLDDPACLSGVETQTILDGFDWIVSGSAAERRVDTGRPLDPHWIPLLQSAERSARRTEGPGSIAAPAPPKRGPKVFVVTPSFNQGLFLRDTIESVLAQDYGNIEYFVADGGSSDQSVEILRSYGDRVRWTSGPDGGQAAAIAKAWSESDADIVAWLNSDDTYLPGAISTAVRYLEMHPDPAVVYGDAWYVDPSGRRLRPYPTRPFDREALAGECFICQPSAFVRRDVFKIVGLPDARLRYCMDYDLWIRISQHFQIDHLKVFLSTSRLHLQNKSLGERSGLLREAMALSRTHFGSVHPKWKQAYAAFRMERAFTRLWNLPGPLRSAGLRLFGGWTATGDPSPPFEDGWAQSQTVVPIAADHDRWMRIEMHVPFWQARRTMRITASCRGRVLAVRRVRPPADLTVTFRLPANVRDGSVLLTASDWFSPLHEGLSADPRMLSFRILDARRGRASTSDARESGQRWERAVAWLRFLPAFLERWLLQRFAPLIDEVVESTPYPDGWTGPRTTVRVEPDASGMVALQCECPVWPFERPLQINVSATDGAPLTTVVVDRPGPFRLTFQVPGRMERVVLSADQSFVPRQHGVSDDPRLLSFRILDGSKELAHLAPAPAAS